MIEVGDDGRTWLLSGPTSSYALHVTGRHELLHLHWGPRLALTDAEALAAEQTPPGRLFEPPTPGAREEYPVEGGPRCAYPALSVRGGGPRGTAWRFDGADADGDALRLSFTVPAHHLEVLLGYRTRGDVVERYAALVHSGPEGSPDLEVLRAEAAAWTLPPRERWRLTQPHGRWAAASRPLRGDLTYGEQVIGGRTGRRDLPWVALDADGATEERGEVYSCALAWSGPWRVVVHRLPGGAVRITGGCGHDDSGRQLLAPGTAMVTPVCAGLWSAGGFGGTSRAWHAYRRAHAVPAADEARPVRHDSWAATGRDARAGQRRAPATSAPRACGAPGAPTALRPGPTAG
ncbi:glycoside hydrolase family 36 N-terminal domain-containing protein [Streptomyces sp. G45]|uniref:glycoside hydrolase family 36 N-terminal domain-containing protein n=1 Tax=Streptomyces sp. G45 TaxID=3406627 RepID=UPI003C2183C7